jgi:hypothetical protein
MGESCGVNGRDPSIRYGSIEMMMHCRLNITAYRYREPSRATEPPGAPSEATPQPGRVEPQPAVQSTQAQESPEMAMPEAGGGPLPRDQQAASERPWWRRMFGG